MSVRGGLATAAIAAALAFAACSSDDEETRIGDAKIIDKLKLEETEDAFAIDGDPFCLVADRLLNTASEVESAEGASDGDLVVASREANVGVVGIPTFPDDCRQVAKKKLNKLDPLGGA